MNEKLWVPEKKLTADEEKLRDEFAKIALGELLRFGLPEGKTNAPRAAYWIADRAMEARERKTDGGTALSDELTGDDKKIASAPQPAIKL